MEALPQPRAGRRLRRSVLRPDDQGRSRLRQRRREQRQRRRRLPQRARTVRARRQDIRRQARPPGRLLQVGRDALDGGPAAKRHHRVGRRRIVRLDRRDKGRGLGQQRGDHRRPGAVQDQRDRFQGSRDPGAEPELLGRGAAPPGDHLLRNRGRQHCVLAVPDRRARHDRRPTRRRHRRAQRPQAEQGSQADPDPQPILDLVQLDKNVRLALSKSIDRDKLVNDIEHGNGKSLATFIPKGMNSYDTSDNAQSFDPAAAKKLLADSGKAAQLSKMKLITRNSTASKTLNQFLADQWSTNLGVTIALDVIDSKTVTRNIRKGQFDIYGLDGWISDYPDPQDWFDIFVTGSCHNLNWGCLSIPAYDDLVSKADAESDKTKRAQEYSQAQKMLVDQA